MSRFDRLARLRQRHEDDAAAAMGRAAATADALEQGLDGMTDSVRDVLADRQAEGWSLRGHAALTEVFIHHRQRAEQDLVEARQEVDSTNETWAQARRDRRSVQRLGERIDERAACETVRRHNKELDEIVVNRFGARR